MADKRECGECRECCIVMDVHSMDKPGGVACKHLCRDGCGIYLNRPNDCREFECVWLQGGLTSTMKPSRVNTVAWFSQISNEEGDWLPVLRITSHPGQKRNTKMLKWAKRISWKYFVIWSDNVTLTGWQDGKPIGTWRMRDQIGFERKGSKVVGIVG